MRRLVRNARRHLTYANVVATLTAFAVLAGGTAFAANHLAKNSIGKKQLKANAVTTAKIKREAVTKAKVRAGAIDGSKIKAGGLTADDLQLGGAPYSRIVAELRSSDPIALTGGEPTIHPLPGFAYTQEAGRTDTYAGAVDFSFPSSCVDRTAIAYLVIDPPTPAKLDLTLLSHAVAAGQFEENGSAAVTRRISLAPAQGGARFAPAAAQSHTFALLVAGGCATGSGIVGNFTAVDVIGTK